MGVPLTVMDHSPVAIDAIGAAGAQKKCAVCPNCEQTMATLSTMLTLYLEADKSSSAGFKITRVVDVEDTEVLQSLATREQAWDVMTCAEVQSEWSDVIVHTAMQP